MLTYFTHNYCVDSIYIYNYICYMPFSSLTHLTQWLSLFASSSCDRCVHQIKVTYFSKASALSWNLSSQRKWQAFMAKVSCPKHGIWICDHDRHANIKPKPDINKNQLNFLKTFTKAFLILFIFVYLLKWYKISLDIQSIYIVLQRIT